jgi:NAD(P)-dependent dehydrogenase (short-subunit alcohol dehydrogenase family)
MGHHRTDEIGRPGAWPAQNHRQRHHSRTDRYADDSKRKALESRDGRSHEESPEKPAEDQVVAARLPRSPLGEPFLQPDQVAPAAVFLASKAAAMVTGACYDVTGGDSAQNSA